MTGRIFTQAQHLSISSFTRKIWTLRWVMRDAGEVCGTFSFAQAGITFWFRQFVKINIGITLQKLYP
jgi:hypothetical protein